MINLEYYRVFYYTAKLKSITAAAKELYISQPAVSQTIKKLEGSLGGTLFFRTPKGMRLTPEGELFYAYVSKGYEYMMQAGGKFKELLELDTGEVRIGASDMTLQFFLLPHLERFHGMYPKVRVKVSNAPTPETLKALDDGRIDFGIVSDPVSGGSGIEVMKVRKIRDVFIAGERFSGLKGRKVRLKELEGYPLICLEPNTSTRRYVDLFLAGRGICLMPEFELSTSELIVQFARRGLGIGCIVEDFLKRMPDDEGLFIIDLETPVPERNICVVTRDKVPVSPAGKKILDIIKNT